MNKFLNKWLLISLIMLLILAVYGFNLKQKMKSEANVAKGQIPTKVLLSIVTGANAKNVVDIKVDSKKVSLYLKSVGGVWYANYKNRFAFPTTGEPLTAEKNVLSKQLEFYYLHRMGNPDNILKFQCNDPKGRRSPTMNGFCGLANYDAYLFSRDKRYYDVFIEWADWFLREQDDNGGWNWDFDVPVRNLKAPWVSGISQSLGMSVLLRAYQSTGNTMYLDAAGKALAIMDKQVGAGGVAIQTENGTWYEEYPEPENPSHVLNGHIWALFGIWDYFRVTNDPQAERMFWNGITVLKSEIHKYDVGYWSVYAQTNRVDYHFGNYMAFIIEQLKALYYITGDKLFYDYSNKWADYQKNDALFVHMAIENYLKSPMAAQ